MFRRVNHMVYIFQPLPILFHQFISSQVQDFIFAIVKLEEVCGSPLCLALLLLELFLNVSSSQHQLLASF